MNLKALAVILFLAAGALIAYNAYVGQLPGIGGTDGTTAVAEKSGARSRSGSGGGSGRGFDGPAPVTIASAAAADVPVYLRGVGTARALATVTVRPQVDGRLLKVHFKEGQDVKRGDLLAEIDPITYRAQLDQAVARRRLTQVQLENAEMDLKRVTSVGPGVVTQKSVDTQRALVAQFEAQLKADDAAIANAEAVLGYTRITSPLDGRTGQRLVDEGNLIRAGDAGIVTIAQLKPLSVQFTIPQQQLNDIKTAMSRGPVPVEALAGDDKTAIDVGTLTFVDNQVDQATGTVKMKADMPNLDLQLWPGQFANVRIRVEVLKNAITVPTAAVQRGPSGAFVYVVSETAGEAAAALRPVVVVQQTETTSVIGQGVEVGERVVTTGFGRLKDGAKISFSSSPPGSPAKGGTPVGISTDAPPGGSPTTGALSTGSSKLSAGERPAESGKSDGSGEPRRRAEGEGRGRPLVQ